MQDPIGNFEQIRELYISYLDTAFRIGDESVAKERRLLLRKRGKLCTEPLVEPIPLYVGHELGFEELLLEDGPDAILAELGAPNSEARRAFLELVLAGLFPSPKKVDPDPDSLSRTPEFKPYSHQVEMLRRGTRTGSPGIVTSGTGSGKTESFLLPLLASIANEAVDWPAPETEYLKTRWWQNPDTGTPYTKLAKDEPVIRFTAIPSGLRPTKKNAARSPFCSHREGEHPDRPAAMRGLILYPMNALVEDQLVRLRKTLDSREAREVMETHMNGNRIFFGRYTGATPVTGHHLHPGLERILEAAEEEIQNESVWFPDHKDADDNGFVSAIALRSEELDRRKRRLTDLFDFMVDAEQGQRDARLLAVNERALQKLYSKLELIEKCDEDDFIEKAIEVGGIEKATLRKEFEERFKRDWSPDEESRLTDSFLTVGSSLEAPEAVGDDAPFLFPSTDGSELVSRWDMQSHPPDILITNVSMLSAMLNREVDAPIFDKTRDWLEREDSYFYLVLDELHLQRGSAGTEVSYLLRMLLHRLGLTAPEQRHKIRILASSASLPDKGEEAENSATYLRDMFGRLGIFDAGTSEEKEKDAWLGSIVSGKEKAGAYDPEEPVPSISDTKPLVAFLKKSIGVPEMDDETPLSKPASIISRGEPDFEKLWKGVGKTLGIETEQEQDVQSLVAICIKETGERLLRACWDQEGNRSRATPVSSLAKRLFGTDTEETRLAVRSLLFIRGAGDGLKSWLGKALERPTSFRLHTFFRSIEGLYAPLKKNEGAPDVGIKRNAEIGKLSIDRASNFGDSRLRQFELVYCECCGELIAGGMKGRHGAGSGYLTELLPYEPNLDGLPDRSASQRFEDLSWEDYGLFWPRWVPKEEINRETKTDGCKVDPGEWIPAVLELTSGGVKKIKEGPRGDGISREEAEENPNYLLGRYYSRSIKKDKTRHRRGGDKPGSNVPYDCPACGTSYSGRKKEFRLSPIRNFRAGFGKTTQRLGSELFDAQRVSGSASPKLVSFSDSRQDAAKGALSIERNHHQEVRRELLALSLRKAFYARESTSDLEEQLKGINQQIREAVENDLDEDLENLVKERNKLNTRIIDASDPSVALQEVLHDPTGSEITGESVDCRDFLTALVKLGIHPFDDAGVRRIKVSEDWSFPWHWVFTIEGSAVYWRDGENDEETLQLRTARGETLREVQRVLTEVIFSKTYFSFEEAGLGYITVSLKDLPEENRTEQCVMEISGLLRVLADCYRYDPSPFRSPNDDPPSPWTTWGQVSASKVRKYAEASWGEEAQEKLENALGLLQMCGHHNGIISVSKLRFRLVERDDQFLRCDQCGRIHLHRGTGSCTRCFKPLNRQGVDVSTIGVRNFLSRRVLRAMERSGKILDPEKGIYRLHCEELTGQTKDGAQRQREFRGIFVPQWESVDGSDLENQRPIQSIDQTFKAKAEIDFLTVTTTMEVGIDIGPLQAVMQANMPPQRFNYQQRVGRAGRRGQAFSMALTICRTRSHDIHYFRQPEKMTGDIPPTPFLTKKLTDIAARFVAKYWLVKVFEELRYSWRASDMIFPTDIMSPPDIHGEFLPPNFFPETGDGTNWNLEINNSLESTRAEVLRFAGIMGECGAGELEDLVEVDSMIKNIQATTSKRKDEPLGHALAELGHLPMYGMPTRVRNLYLNLRKEKGRREWVTVDRDIDVAIYEFAPGSIVVIDKKEHLAVGLTPDLAPPLPVTRAEQELIPFQSRSFGEEFWIIDCGNCRAWKSFDRSPNEEDAGNCNACHFPLDPAGARRAWVPNAFRTDFRPTTRQENADGGVRHRSIQAEARELDFEPIVDENVSLEIDLDPESRSIRLNRGPRSEDGMIFELKSGTQAFPWDNKLKLPLQTISTEPRLEQRVKNFDPDGNTYNLWLAAPKTTDSLFLKPASNPPGLSLPRLPAMCDSDDDPEVESARWLGVRAAAISASHILVNRISLDLDIDPEEFDVLEPRIYGRGQGRLPILQIADNLVNGAGFCRYLADQDGPGSPPIVKAIMSIIADGEGRKGILNKVDEDFEKLEYPFNEFFSPEHAHCDTACYRCLQRFGNQPFHGILDWQVGGAYLRAITDPEFRCGLDGNFEFWAIEKWPDTAKLLADQMANRFDGEVEMFGQVPAFRCSLGNRKKSAWVLVSHPLWDWDDEGEICEGTILAKAREEAGEFGAPRCWDTFNLARRQVKVREWL